MTISSCLKWHGGKAYLASRIGALLPRCIHYVEPYFGGGSLLLARNPDGVSEVVNDLHGGLVNFWRVLQSEVTFARFQRRVEATPFCEAEWIRARAVLDIPPACEVEWAWAFFVACRQSLAGRMKSFTGITKTRTRRRMNNETSAWLSCIEGLPAVHERLKRVLIIGPRPALDVIRSQDGKDTLFYLDPPYLHETRATTGDYTHEMSVGDHQELLGAISGIRGKFALSGYRCDLYDEVAERNGWRRVDFDIANHAAGGAAKRRMTECVWMNYEERI